MGLAAYDLYGSFRTTAEKAKTLARKYERGRASATPIVMASFGRDMTTLTDMAEGMLRIDEAKVRPDPAAAIVAMVRTELRYRVEALEYLIVLRPLMLKRVPKMEGYWKRDTHIRMTVIAERSRGFLVQIENGTVQQWSRDETIAGMDRLAPYILDGSFYETPAEVVDFCAREGMGGNLVFVSGIIRETFPKARRLRLAVESDREGDAQWIAMHIDVPDDPTLPEQYEAYLTRWLSKAKWPDSKKLRLHYVVT